MLTEIKIPPGMAQNGTKYQNRGRWVDGNLIRFHQGTVRPIGGWSPLLNGSAVAQTVSAYGRAALSYRGLNGAAQAVFGCYDKLFAWSLGVKTDITPSDLAAGFRDTGVSGGGYGQGAYGAGPFGQGVGTTVQVADVWHFDTFGDYLVACYPTDGRILLWNRNTATDAAEIDADAPTSCRGVVVSPERFVVALCAGGDGRTIEWCDQENYATWDWAAPAAGSQAGRWTFEGEGTLIGARRGKKETLFWTTKDLHAMRYIGGTLVHSFEQVGYGCGLVGPQAVAMLGSKAIWMSYNGFYMYDGFVTPLPCDVQDEIFSNVETSQGIKVQAIVNDDWNEVTWLYPTVGSNECDAYVTYNWAEQTWTTGRMDRTAGCARGAFDYPIYVATNGALMEHEKGHTFLNTGVVLGVTPSATYATPFLESAPVQMDAGDRTADVVAIVPDEKTLGDVQVSVYTAYYPTETEILRGPYTLANPTSVRWTARQMRLRLDQVRAADWRFGTLRVDVEQGSRR